MTDAPSSYDESYPALGLNNSNTSATYAANANISQHNSLKSSWSSHSQTTQTIGQQQHQKHHNQQQPQNKLNYMRQIQHLYQQQQQQQNEQQQASLNHLASNNADDDQNSMPSQYQNNLQQQSQPQQPQTQSQQQTNQSSIQNNNIINNNNNITMQASNPVQQQHKRPGLANPNISERCCTFKIAPEERRHRDFELEQSKILKEIMQKTNTKIEVTTTKDQALNFCIIGKEAVLPVAKNLVLNDFQTSVTLTVSVPKSIHGRLLGPKGARLAAIQDETQTKITIPRKEEDSDIIKITGLKNNAELAIRSIEKYAREFAGKTVEKVTIERIYLLFITGPFNESLKRWEGLGAKVSTSGGILPSNSDRESGHADEVTFTIAGETTAVHQVKEEILHTYEDKKKKCTHVCIEIPRVQHKYILGPGGHNLRNFFEKTGVSVELPQENDSVTVTLRGERSKLGPALHDLFVLAHSETDDFFEVETWLHKYLIGARKTNPIDFKSLGVEAKSLDDRIRLHGPTTEVENIKELFENELKTIRKTFIRKDIRVEPRIHGYVIGRAGATVDQIRDESGAYVLVPKNDEPSEYITLEGTQEAVAIAEEKINAIAKKYEASRKLVIDQQLHGSIIGRGGEKIRSIREKFSQVVFTFPEQGSKHNEITIVGPTEEVEECYKYLDEFHQQLQENNHQVQVPIKRDIIKYLQDAQNAIKRIRVEHKVKIDIFINQTTSPNKGSSGGNKDSVKAQETPVAVGESQNGAAGETADSSGAKKKSGAKKSAKKDQQPPATASISQVQQTKAADTNTGGNKSSNSESYAVVIGKREDLDEAKVKLSKLFEELATTTEIEVKFPYKLRSVMGPNTRVCRQFLDEFQQKVVVIFPQVNKQQQQNQDGSKQGGKQQQVAQSGAGGDVTGSEVNGVVQPAVQGAKSKATTKDDGTKDRIETVKLRAPKNIVKKAEKKFEALIAESQDRLAKNNTAYVMVETAVIDKFLYTDKLKLNKIRDSQTVKLNIPDKRDTPKLQCTIIGYEKNVQQAVKQFNALVKEVAEREEETIEIPSAVHPRLIGSQGRAVKKLMEDYKVGVKFARQGDVNPDAVTLSGRSDCISAAKNHMLKLVDQYMSSAIRANNNNSDGKNASTNNNNNINNSQQQQQPEQPQPQ